MLRSPLLLIVTAFLEGAHIFDYFGTALHAGGKGAATGVHRCGLLVFVCMCFFLCVLCLLRYPRERQRAGVL